MEPNQTVAKNATTASDGKVYDVTFYNLDVIISVGYRVKSKDSDDYDYEEDRIGWAFIIIKELQRKISLIVWYTCLIT